MVWSGGLKIRLGLPESHFAQGARSRRSLMPREQKRKRCFADGLGKTVSYTALSAQRPMISRVDGLVSTCNTLSAWLALDFFEATPGVATISLKSGTQFSTAPEMRSVDAPSTPDAPWCALGEFAGGQLIGPREFPDQDRTR